MSAADYLGLFQDMAAEVAPIIGGVLPILVGLRFVTFVIQAIRGSAR